ncbi:hypothetical protein Nepgr_006385 [Nepenthes gracilis]|uniref:Sugar phosphate transporter domain-containing protein n=1 Tax=Nepenthes gracilis TaxID=150966 RepID=A0AAD3XHD0_NEPGR|nr:hypothetical protein Nepgr_006385 [Nepenthes gracilis]
MASSENQTLNLVETDRSRLENGRQKGMTRAGIYAALSYMASAVLLVMFNKAALSSYNFPYVNVITLFQMICSCLILYAMRRWNIISFTTGEFMTVNNGPVTLVPLKTLGRTLPLSLSYLLYMVASMESVRGINVPMYTTLRRTTVAITMVVEYLLTGQKCSRFIVGSVSIIVLGAFVAGARDLSFDTYSYAIVFISNVCTAVYLASIARVGKSSGLNSFGLMWSNGIICGPILLIWTFIHGDLEKIINFTYLLSLGFQVVMLLSSLTQSICGNLKDLFTIGLGWLVFGGLPFDMFNILGQCLGFLGSCLYAYCKLNGK